MPSGGGSPGGSRTLEVERHECAAPAAAGAAGVDGDAEFNVLLQDSARVEEREGETPRRESLRMEDVTAAEEEPPLPPSGRWRSNQGGGALDRVRRLEDDICASQVAEAKAAADLLHHESRLPIGQREGSPACRLQPAPEAAAAAAAAGVSRLPRKRPRAAPPPETNPTPASTAAAPTVPKAVPVPQPITTIARPPHTRLRPSPKAPPTSAAESQGGNKAGSKVSEGGPAPAAGIRRGGSRSNLDRLLHGVGKAPPPMKKGRGAWRR